MVASLFFFTLSDAVSKWLTQSYPIGEIIFLRSFFIYVPVLLLIWYRRDGGTLRTRRWQWHLARTITVIAATYLIILSVKLLPLADAVAFLFAAPIMITAMATPLLGEPVGWRRWCAVIVGFVGVLIMVRPTADAFQIAALVPIAAAAMTAVRDIVTRRMSAGESTNAMMVWSTLGLIIGSAPVAAIGWVTPDMHDLLLIALSGLLVGAAHFLMIESYRLAQAAVVAPFKYSAILWGVLLGYLIWGDLPDAWIMTGAILIVASGLYILHRESAAR
ncbi:MAG: DMT family transporter [Alphaproteobacteria bacterium]|nr:DMT family transporter [Alphaproteobacteria bacterium]